jgi:ribonucleoside-diphosphate reductase alpha chain
MELGHEGTLVKPAPGQRERLPNRRAAETLAFERDRSRYKMTIGYFRDGRPGEVFLTADRPDSLLDVLAHDAAIIASIALQFGCPLDAIRHALKRDSQGTAASPIGQALDLIS